MKRKPKRIAIGAMLLLLMALCVPVFSGALAEGEEEPLIVPIEQSTNVYNADGSQIGTLAPDGAGGSLLRLTDNTEYQNLQVIFDFAAANAATATEKTTGRALVSLKQAETETTQDMPKEGWIDVTLIVSAQSEKIRQYAGENAALSDQLAKLVNTPEAPTLSPQPVTPTPNPTPKAVGMFSAESIAIWTPVAAVVLGIAGVGALVWMAISAASAAWEAERQTKQMIKVADALKDGIAIRSPLKIEQDAWPKSGRVAIVSEPIDQLAEIAKRGGMAGMQSGAWTQQPVEPVAPPVREGEEPELLALANRLAGVASSSEWNAIVADAGWRAVQLQSNPTEKGTYIVDDSGYSIIACLARGAEPEIAYVLPSYQDPNASEPRWVEFYSITEYMSVKNYRVEALPVMFIERGTFFLQKSKGRLIRRPQYY